jgi:predicted MFS family arabinose efflux permease
VLLGFAGFGLFWGSWGAVLPVVQRSARVSDGELGLALVFIGIGALATLRAVGSLADRHPRATLPAGLALLGLSAVVPAFAVGPVWLLLACVLIGVCSGVADAAINAAGAACEARGARVLSLGHGVFSALVVAASLATAGLLLHASSPWPLLATGGVLLLTAAVSAVLPGPAVSRAHRVVGAGGRWRRRPPAVLVLLGGLGAVAYLVENAWQSWAAIQLHTTLGTSAAVAAAGPAVFAAFAALGRFAGHPLQRRVSARGLFGAAAALAATGSGIGALAPSAPVAIAGIALAGAGTSVCAPTLIAVAAGTAPDRPGAATSTVITLSYLGFVLGPAAVGLLAQLTTLPTALTAVAAAAAALAVASSPLQRIHPT